MQEVKFMDTYSATVSDQGEITIKRHGMPIVYYVDNVLRDAIYELAMIQENLVK